MRFFIIVVCSFFIFGCKEKLQTKLLIDFVGDTDHLPAKNIRVSLEHRFYSDGTSYLSDNLLSDSSGTLNGLFKLDRNTRNGYYFMQVLGNEDYAGLEADIPVIPGQTNYHQYNLLQRFPCPIRFSHSSVSSNSSPVYITVWQKIPHAVFRSFVLDQPKGSDTTVNVKLLLNDAAKIIITNSKTWKETTQTILIDNFNEKIISY